jgi:hypothetical protein
MGLFGTISSKQIDEFAGSLVEELLRNAPAAPDERQKKMSEKKMLSALDSVLRRAKEFTTQNKLGVYKKARLANTFKWEMQEKGFHSDFVEFATQGLVMLITRKE